MKHRFSLLLATLIFFIFGCSQENEEKNTHDSKHSLEKNISKTAIATVIAPKEIESLPVPIEEYTYTFTNLKEQNNTLHIVNDVYNFRNIKQPIVIVTLMSTWCPPCRGQIPHLSKLQQKFKEHIFIMGTLVHDDISDDALHKFITAQKMFFYLSNKQDENLKFANMLMPKLGLTDEFPMPLTLVFVKGRYFTHYEGMVPEEMIESDIKQLLQKIK